MDLQKQHDADVAKICEAVKTFHKDKKHFRIYHGSTGSTRPMAFKPGSIVDTSTLTRIFPIDKEKMTVKVEPKVAMDELLAAVQKQGYLPEVVPELMGITAGGAFSGTAGESSSYRFGLFEETVTNIEIILGDGTLTTAGHKYQRDLYDGAQSSMGTVGIVTLLEIRLVKAKPYIQLDIVTAHGLTDAINKIEDAIANPKNEYIDGMLFSKDFGVVMFGRLVDKPQDGAQIRSFMKRNDPWFTNYIEKVGNQKADPKPICLTPYDYFFRYDKGVFWGGKLGFDYFHVPFNRITRWLLDPLMGSRVAYHALHEGGFASKYIVQDFDMPASKCQPFVDYISSILPNYQFWLCPAKTGEELNVIRKFRAPGGDPAKLECIRKERIYNVGVYGKGTNDFDKFVKLNREIEHKLWHDFCGVKILYAHAYYTEEEFWETYNKEVYDECRRRYKGESLPTVYDKISSDMNSGKKPRKHGAGTLGAIRGILGVIDKKRATSFLLDKKGRGYANTPGAGTTNGASGPGKMKEEAAVGNGAANGHIKDGTSQTSAANGIAKEETATPAANRVAPEAKA